jgi:hypothetical protein
MRCATPWGCGRDGQRGRLKLFADRAPASRKEPQLRTLRSTPPWRNSIQVGSDRYGRSECADACARCPAQPLAKNSSRPSDLAGSKFCRRFLGTPRSVTGLGARQDGSESTRHPASITWAYTKALHAAWPPRDDLVRAGKRVRTVLMTRVGVCQPVRARARDRRAGALTTLPHGTRTRARDRGVPQ